MSVGNLKYSVRSVGIGPSDSGLVKWWVILLNYVLAAELVIMSEEIGAN